MRQFLTTGGAARMCQVSTMTIKKWIGTGKLKAFRTPGGHYRIDPGEFEKFLAAYRFPSESEDPPRVLVVDDDPSVVEALVTAFRALLPEFKLEAASGGYEGLIKIGTFRPHLLVLDLRMPGLDGFEVCRRVKSDPALLSTNILAVTAYPEEFSREKALQCGADAFFVKPLNIGELIARVKSLVG